MGEHRCYHGQKMLKTFFVTQDILCDSQDILCGSPDALFDSQTFFSAFFRALYPSFPHCDFLRDSTFTSLSWRYDVNHLTPTP